MLTHFIQTKTLLQKEAKEWLVALLYTTVFIALFACAAPAVAQTTDMPWDSALCRIARSLSGTTASAIAVIVLVIGGIMLAAGELGGVFKWAGGVMMGFSLMFGGVKVLSWFNVAYSC